MDRRDGFQANGTSIGGPLERNIQSLMSRRERERRQASFVDKAAAAIAAFTGSMWSVLVHAVIFSAWILINIRLLPIVEPWDQSLVVLAMIASVEAIFLTTFVLMNQNRIARLDDERAELTLQISLLSEYEMTKMAEVVSAIARHLEVAAEERSELDNLTDEVEPEKVLEAIRNSKPD
jgi:uncharacterized membrane protein